jgi:hypothetical protein
MIKVADKPSMDPVQQKLRLAKKQWNKDVSAFIDNLIHYKWLTNGRPNKFYKEKSNIKDPIPADPVTILGTLANDFQELAQRGNAIIAQQIEYSKTRRKSQPKSAPTDAVPTPATPAAPTPTPDLSQQLTAYLEDKYHLVAEGSNPITRFFARLLTPTFGVSEAARIRKYRMTLLDAVLRTFKDLEKLQVEIVKSSPDSVMSSNKMLHKVWNDWMLVYRGFSTYRSNMPNVVKDTGGDIPPSEDLQKEREKEKKRKTEPPPELVENYEADEKLPVQEPTAVESPPAQPEVPADQEAIITGLMFRAKEIISDYTRNFRRLNSADMGGYDVALESAITKFLKSPGQYKPIAAQVVITTHANLVSSLNRITNTTSSSMGDVVKELAAREAALKKNQKAPKAPAAVAPASDQLEAIAQDFLKKWIGKARHQLSIFDKTSVYRLDIYKMAGEIRSILDQIMNSLEKGMNNDEIEPLIVQINRKIMALRGLMRALNNVAPGNPRNKPLDDPSWGQRVL